MSSQLRQPVGTRVLIGIFTVSGTFHLLTPHIFYALIPPWLGSPYFWAVSSGVAELLCAVGLLTRQPWAPKFTAMVLLGIWVGNWYYAIMAISGSSVVLAAVAWLRLPLQIPMIRWALASPTKVSN